MTRKAIVYSPETVAALDGSIEKWRSIRDGVGEDHGMRNCSLCRRFYLSEGASDQECERKDGERCPVMRRTGSAGCAGSPYDEWDSAVNGDTQCKATTPELVALAQKELDFLESLKWEKE